MNGLDYAILLSTLLGIAAYGMWRTRGRTNLSHYLKGAGNTSWIVIGLSVMATQASAITFLSTPGQGYEDGLGFVQNYFGAPFALILISAVFLPIYRRLNVYTAYEFLGRRFDAKTRLLGAMLFLVQRGIGAGLTIYAPAIVLSTVIGWPLDLTIIASGTVVIIYTVSGGSEAVNVTQKYQIGIIFAGMIAAFFVLLHKLPQQLSFADALTVAGGFNKLNGVTFSTNVQQRYTFWSGLLGGFFLQLSYFGTDQSQVQRYISGNSLAQSRLGLMFNAVCKIPMQFFILLLGVLVFVFYQFQPAPVYFDREAWNKQIQHGNAAVLQPIERQFADAQTEEREYLQEWLSARHSGNAAIAEADRVAAMAAHERANAIRVDARNALNNLDPASQKTKEPDYVFITFILDYLPHGLIGLLVAVFFAAAMSSKSAELNALGSTTTVDLYRHVIQPRATDEHYVTASKGFTIFWGLFAIGFALFANFSDNLIQAVNIVGSIFYGVVLGMFLVAFFLRWINGTAVFWAALMAQALVFIMFYKLDISYLWYNLIGCAACMIFSIALQAVIGNSAKPQAVGE